MLLLDNDEIKSPPPPPGGLTAFGDVFSVIGVREPQAAASEAFVKFAEAHRNIEKYGIQLLKTIKPVRISLFLL